MYLSDYGLTLSKATLLLFLSAAAIAVVILLSVFLKAVGALAVYRMLKKNKNGKEWRAFVPVLSQLALGDLAGVLAPRRKALGKAAAVLSAASAATLFAGTVMLFNALIRLLFAADSAAAAGAEKIEESAFAPLLSAFAVLAVWAGIWLLKHIFRAVCLGSVYRLAGSSPLLAVVGFVFPVLIPVFLYAAAGKYCNIENTCFEENGNE